VRIGMKAAGTAARKLLKIRALLVFSTTYAFFAFNLLNAIWYQARGLCGKISWRVSTAGYKRP